MPNPFDAIADPIRKLHAMSAHNGELINFEAAGSGSGDWYDESDTSEFDALAPETVPIRVARGEDAGSEYTAGGIEVTADVVIIVDPTDVSAIREPGGDLPASEIIDPAGPSDTRYRVTRVDDDGSGLWMAQCERLDE
jgi:hypothetical protein